MKIIKRLNKCKNIVILTILVLLLSSCKEGLSSEVIQDHFDNTVPVITLVGEAEVEIAYCGSYEEDGYFAMYSELDITDKVQVSKDFDTCTIGEHIITYTVEYNEKSISVTRTIIVTSDTGIEIDLVGKDLIYLDVGESFIDSGITIFDETTNTYITENILVSNNVDINTPGTYLYTYTTTIRNVDYSISRTYVVNTVTSVDIDLLGSKEVTIYLYSNYIDDGCTSSYKDKDLTSLVVIDSQVDTNIVGSYQVTCNIEFQGISRSVSRTVHVIDPGVDIDLVGSDLIKLEVGESYIDPGIEIIDNLTNERLTNNIVILSNVDNMKEGLYEYKYEITLRGNTYSIVRSYVVNNPTEINFELIGDEEVKVLQYSTYVDEGCIANTDYLNLNEEVIIDSDINTSIEGTYTYKCSINKFGLSYELTRIVNVYIPNITVELIGEEYYLLSLNTNYNDPGISFYDEDENVDISNYVNVSSDLNITVLGHYTVTYTLNYKYQEYVYKRHLEVINFKLIYTTRDFLNIINDTSSNYLLMNDLDFNNISFTSLSNIQNKITGIIDGNGYTISNILLQENNNENKSIFGYNEGTIKNFNIENVTIEGISQVALLTDINYGTIERINTKNIELNSNANASLFSYRTVNGVSRDINLHFSKIDVDQLLGYESSSYNSNLERITIDIDLLYSNSFYLFNENNIENVSYKDIYLNIDNNFCNDNTIISVYESANNMVYTTSMNFNDTNNSIYLTIQEYTDINRYTSFYENNWEYSTNGLELKHERKVVYYDTNN